MWNFSLPYKVKHVIDLVAQRNYLFSYDGKQYGPLLKVEKAIAVYTRVSRSWRVLLYRRRSTTMHLTSTSGCDLLVFGIFVA